MKMAVTSSGLKAASAAITALPGRFHGLVVVTDGTNAATIIVYDNASAASGTVLAKVLVPGASGYGVVQIPDQGIEAINGIYCSVSGTGAAAVVYYSNG